jgi:hypothetical protein
MIIAAWLNGKDPSWNLGGSFPKIGPTSVGTHRKIVDPGWMKVFFKL